MFFFSLKKNNDHPLLSSFRIGSISRLSKANTVVFLDSDERDERYIDFMTMLVLCPDRNFLEIKITLVAFTFTYLPTFSGIRVYSAWYFGQPKLLIFNKSFF